MKTAKTAKLTLEKRTVKQLRIQSKVKTAAKVVLEHTNSSVVTRYCTGLGGCG